MWNEVCVGEEGYQLGRELQSPGWRSWDDNMPTRVFNETVCVECKSPPKAGATAAATHADWFKGDNGDAAAGGETIFDSSHNEIPPRPSGEIKHATRGDEAKRQIGKQRTTQSH